MLRSTFRALAVITVITAWLAAAPARSAQSGSQGNQQQPSGDDTPSITITATDFRFSPAEIHATAGQPFRLTLVNKGNSVHSIRFQLRGREYPFPTNVPPGRSETAVIDGIGDAGQYTFYCPVDEHRSHGMTGTLIVSGGK